MSLKLHNIHKACLTANLHWVQVFHVQVLWYLTVQTNQRAHHEEEELGNLIWNKNTPFAARVVSHRLKVAQRGWGASLQLWRSSKPHWAWTYSQPEVALLTLGLGLADSKGPLPALLCPCDFSRDFQQHFLLVLHQPQHKLLEDRNGADSAPCLWSSLDSYIIRIASGEACVQLLNCTPPPYIHFPNSRLLTQWSCLQRCLTTLTPATKKRSDSNTFQRWWHFKTKSNIVWLLGWRLKHIFVSSNFILYPFCNYSEHRTLVSDMSHTLQGQVEGIRSWLSLGSSNRISRSISKDATFKQ